MIKKSYKAFLPLAILLFWGCEGTALSSPVIAQTPPAPAPQIVQQTVIDFGDAEPLQVAKALNTAMADTVEKVLPSVVVIRTESTRYIVDWYGRLLSEAKRPVGQGSGVIIDPRGYVITNNHVLQGGQSIEVILQDETSYQAQVVGRNTQLDIAVLKIMHEDGHLFPAIEAGDSDAIRVGEMVMAIGSPFSLSSTVTNGLISQKGRNEANLPIVDFIQTSAPINPGNSGGPLIDVEGKLIGINTMIRTGSATSQGSIGIGFAIPSNQALRAAKLIIDGTSPEELPWLGVMMQDTRFGVLFSRIIPNSPAADAGMEPGDLLLTVDRRTIRSGAELSSLIRLSEPGDQLSIELLRGKEKIVRVVTTRLMPESELELIPIEN
ncbi:trypsin-like peptidase domain-containing protein [Kiritimatiellaeota bacterium B1221]|nr:trypsin-like peptidase domain-containing protein [Kiritimatiellaeota bacterium B1221]